MNRPNDPFVELDEIARAVGEKVAKNIAKFFSDYIVNTCRWMDDIGRRFETFENYLSSDAFDLSDLYFDAYALFDDSRYVALLKNAGFDGAIHGGSGETTAEAEFKVFDVKQVWPVKRIRVRTH